MKQLETISIDLNDYPENLSCCLIARSLIKAGHDPKTKVCFVRARTPIFNELISLNYFASRRVVESHNGEPMKCIRDPYILPKEKPNGPRADQAA